VGFQLWGSNSLSRVMDAREHVTEPGKRFDAALLAGSDEGSQHCRCLAAAVAAEE